LNYAASGYAFDRRTNTYGQTVTVTNVLSQTITDPIYLVLGNLSSNATLTNKTGDTVNNTPGSPYISVSPSGLAPGASVTVSLKFTTTGGGITDTLSVIHTAGTP
ncbi:MAG: hypothetical protein ABJF10_08945, partial [Chthoniobacter sp.]